MEDLFQRSRRKVMIAKTRRYLLFSPLMASAMGQTGAAETKQPGLWGFPLGSHRTDVFPGLYAGHRSPQACLKGERERNRALCFPITIYSRKSQIVLPF